MPYGANTTRDTRDTRDNPEGARGGNNTEQRTTNDNEDSTIRVLVIPIRPYIYNGTAGDGHETKSDDSKGFYYHIWDAIKTKINEIRVSRGMSLVRFEETIAKVGQDQDQGQNLDAERGAFDIVIGNGLVDTHTPSKSVGWLSTRDIFVRDYRLLYRRENRVYMLFYRLFLQKYLPIVGFLLIISLFLGQILYAYTPRVSRKNAVWQTLTAMMGEFGYLAEKMSDHHKKTTIKGYIVATIILMICLYCFVYIQATINTTMFYSKNAFSTNVSFNEENKIYTVARLDTPTDAHVDGMAYPSLRFIRDSGGDIRNADLIVQYRSILERYLADDGLGVKLDGVLVDTMVVDALYAEIKGRKSNLRELTSAPFAIGQKGIPILVHPSQMEVYHIANEAILRLHSNHEIERLCQHHTQTQNLPGSDFRYAQNCRL